MDTQTQQKQIGNAVRKARINAGLTQKQLGDLVGVTQQSINLIETGKRRFDLYLFFDIRNALKKYNQVLLPEESDYFDGFDQLNSQKELSKEELLYRKKEFKLHLLLQYKETYEDIKAEIHSLNIELNDLQNRIEKTTQEINVLVYEIDKINEEHEKKEHN